MFDLKNRSLKLKNYFIIFFALITGVVATIKQSIGAKINNSKSEIKSQTGIEGSSKVNNISNIAVKDMKGKEVSLSSYNGKVLLIVNVASNCGFTPQYKDLQELYEKYKDQGFEILGFPCNDFGGQEPGSNQEIKQFCSLNYGVTFKLLDKIKILGKEKNSLYKVLTNNDVTGKKEIGWNFVKFVIAKNGDIVDRFSSRVKPLDEKITTVIEQELAKK
jgi:glutathione peroxidase